jgi:hypothetical protein
MRAVPFLVLVHGAKKELRRRQNPNDLRRRRRLRVLKAFAPPDDRDARKELHAMRRFFRGYIPPRGPYQRGSRRVLFGDIPGECWQEARVCYSFKTRS